MPIKELRTRLFFGSHLILRGVLKKRMWCINNVRFMGHVYRICLFIKRYERCEQFIKEEWDVKTGYDPN